ncbi:NADPH-dependent FMN reductase [Rhizobium alvei]|uniref:NADPH-dependent FMN reductase n=1 Tax=Rhizobium alvei TaxID=1132659 RepID=A0ABT8YGE9_9HYPH|nr:NADPH-dependent FMN reductase [Rhizobium alvei]MDO6962748.1 NADPH-dependent FMN reductase [Rhizobium alvei]
MTLKLNIIIGSTRPGRVGPKIASWFKDFAASHGKFDVELVDLADFNLPLLDEAAHPRMQKYEHEATKRWSQSVSAADAFIFVTPEYDFFPPASLVNAVQCLLVEWGYKPASVVSYGGVSAGLRATQGLRQLLNNVNMMPIPQTVPLPFFPNFLKEDGFQPNDQVIEGTTLMLNELHKWAGALKPLRG